MTNVRFTRRTFLHLAAGAAALPALSRIARAQAYPSRPVRIVVGVPPGGTQDSAARLVGQWLSQRLHQPFIIDNRPGAASNLATEAVIRSAPDGYTLLLAFATATINATLFDKLNHNFIRDIAPVASILRLPLILVVHPSFPANTVGELIAYAKANPGKVNVGVGGIGSAPHMASELLQMRAGVDMARVPYRGAAPMLTDLLGGQVQVAFDGVTSSIEHVRSGKLRALAVATAARLEALPSVPTVADTVPDFEASGWSGVGAPKATPSEIVEKINGEINAGLADPFMKARLADLGVTPFIASPAEFGGFIADETDKWAKVIRTANIKAE